MASRRKKPKFKHVHTGRLAEDKDHGLVLWVVEQVLDTPAFGIVAGGLVDARLKDKKVRVTVEEV
jgi:hypothetical protein